MRGEKLLCPPPVLHRTGEKNAESKIASVDATMPFPAVEVEVMSSHHGTLLELPKNYGACPKV